MMSILDKSFSDTGKLDETVTLKSLYMTIREIGLDDGRKLHAAPRLLEDKSRAE
jgi:hypothetical protein